MGKKWEKKAKKWQKKQKNDKKVEKRDLKNYASVSTVLSIKTLPL